MTDRTDLLLEIIEHPDKFTDERLEEILSDPETRKLYRLLNKTGDALADISLPDIDKEWKHFEDVNTSIRKRSASKFREFLGRRRAAVAVCAVIAIGAVAAGIGIGARHASHKPSSSTEMNVKDMMTVNIDGSNLASDTILTLSSAEAAVADTILFKNENLDVIIKEIGRYYGAESRFDNPASKELRLYFKWDQSLPLSEIVEQLNGFEQINIKLSDNSLIIK